MRWPRFSLRSLLVSVACVSLAMWTWVAHLSPVARWNRVIHSDDRGIERWQAASQAIAGRVPGVDRDKAISGLCAALVDPSPRVRETAAATLKLTGPESRYVVPHLVRALKDGSPTVRWQAAESLGLIVGRNDPARETAAPALVAALKDRSRDVRLAAGFSLAVMRRGDPAIPIMEATIRDGLDQAGKARLALALCGSRDAESVRALILAKGSSYLRIRQAVTDALGRLADPDREF